MPIIDVDFTTKIQLIYATVVGSVQRNGRLRFGQDHSLMVS